jgi:hypothetical protein
LQLAAIFLALKQMIKHTQIRPNELDWKLLQLFLSLKPQIG